METPSTEPMEETLDLALTGRTKELREKILAKLGSRAIEQAEAMARTLASEKRLPYNDLLAGALWSSQFVMAFNGCDNPKLYKCAVCHDEGWQSDDVHGKSTAAPCGNCELGLNIEAGNWLDITRPMGRGGKRYDSREGRQAFERALHHLPKRRELLQDRMNDLERGSRAGKAVDDGKWD